MASSTAIPVASYGNNSQVAQEVRAQLLPEYDVVHICLDLETATSELPAICAGRNMAADPASGLGTNAALPAAERKVPKAVIFGGGIPDEEVARVGEAVRASAPGVRLVRVARQEVLDAGAERPSPEVIVGILRGKLAGLS